MSKVLIFLSILMISFSVLAKNNPNVTNDIKKTINTAKSNVDDLKNSSDRYLFIDSGEKEEKKKDFFSFLAPENYISFIFFIIIIVAVITMKRIFFDDPKVDD